MVRGGERGKGGTGNSSKYDQAFGKAPQQKTVVFVDQHFADQAVRLTEERKAREETLAEQGLSVVEIKAARRREMLRQEEHHDDCGSGSALLEENPINQL